MMPASLAPKPAQPGPKPAQPCTKRVCVASGSRGESGSVGMVGLTGPVTVLSTRWLWPSPGAPSGLAAPPQCGTWGSPGGPRGPTWGKPVRILARLGEQLLTEVKAFWKTTPRRASASRLGVLMAELL